MSQVELYGSRLTLWKYFSNKDELKIDSSGF